MNSYLWGDRLDLESLIVARTELILSHARYGILATHMLPVAGGKLSLDGKYLTYDVNLTVKKYNVGIMLVIDDYIKNGVNTVHYNDFMKTVEMVDLYLLKNPKEKQL